MAQFPAHKKHINNHQTPQNSSQEPQIEPAQANSLD